MKCKDCPYKTDWSIINHCENCTDLSKVGWYNTKQPEQLYTEDYVKELKNEINKLKETIKKSKRFLWFYCYCNERALTFNECNKLYQMLDEGE